jgi:tRNA(fMet)-specific endonuclease VapC
MNTVGSVLVDTTIVIAYFRGDQALPQRFAEFKPVYVPWVVLGELHFGAQRAQRRQEQLAYISDFVTTEVILFPDQATTECYGQLKADLAQMGRPIPDNDLWIAAMALQHGLPLATQGRALRASAKIADVRLVAIAAGLLSPMRRHSRRADASAAGYRFAPRNSRIRASNAIVF